MQAQEPFVIDLRATLETLADTVTYKRRMSGIMGKPQVAATLAGYELEWVSKGGGESRHKTKKVKTEHGKAKQGKQTNPGKGGGATMEKSDKAKGKMKVAGEKQKGQVGSSVIAKRIFPYADGTYSHGEQAQCPSPHTSQCSIVQCHEG